MTTKTQIQNHLEYLDYEVITQDDNLGELICSKEGAPPLLIACTDSCIWFYASYRINSIAKSNKDNFLIYINNLNSKSFSTNYFLTENEEIAFAGMYFGKYDKKIFSSFVSNWEYDVINKLDLENDTNLYLGDPNRVITNHKLNDAWA